VGAAGTTLVVRTSLPARTLMELTELARREPGKYSYATGSTGGTAHLAALLYQQVADIRLLHVPYAGAGQAMNDLAGGHVDMTFSALNAVSALVDAGKVRILATSAAERLSGAPEVPTFAEAGLPGVVVSAFWGVYAPAGTPAATVTRINAALVGATSTPAVMQELERRGIKPVSNTPAEHARILRDEFAKWGEVIRRAGIPRE
jgi:tripartite-type tricarboxylate transporter receptor subunit TctC